MSIVKVREKPAPCATNRILVVDDQIRDVLKQVLELELPECKVDVAVNGAEAVEMFRHAHHALLLLDLHMAVMDGEKAFLEVDKFCAEQNWEMPAVVFLTAYDPSHRLQTTIRRLPRHCILTKPVSNEILVEAIRSRLPKNS